MLFTYGIYLAIKDKNAKNIALLEALLKALLFKNEVIITVMNIHDFGRHGFFLKDTIMALISRLRCENISHTWP